jgi:hypothetical protein
LFRSGARKQGAARNWRSCRRRSRSSSPIADRPCHRGRIIVLFAAAVVWACGAIDVVASATGKILPGGRVNDPAV